MYSKHAIALADELSPSVLRNATGLILVVSAGFRAFTTSQVLFILSKGAYVGPTQDHLIRVVSELGIDTSFVNEREDLVLYKNVSVCNNVSK